MTAVKKRTPRKYTGVLQFFHNHEHSPGGLTHCHSDGIHPFRIRHAGGRHIISNRIAVGHGRGNKPQRFRFTKRLGDGWDMASGVKEVAKPQFKTPAQFDLDRQRATLKPRRSTKRVTPRDTTFRRRRGF